MINFVGLLVQASHAILASVS